MPKKRKRDTLRIINVNLDQEVVVLSDFSLCRIYEWLDGEGDYCDKENADIVIFVTPWNSVHTARIEDIYNKLH
jgi:hypothetical protein